MTGVVIEALPRTLFRVQVDKHDHLVLCTLSGRMRKNKIRVLLGDAVEIEMTPYDLSRGRITRRQK